MPQRGIFSPLSFIIYTADQPISQKKKKDDKTYHIN